MLKLICILLNTSSEVVTTYSNILVHYIACNYVYIYIYCHKRASSLSRVIIIVYAEEIVRNAFVKRKLC